MKSTKKAQRSIAAMNLKAKPKRPGSYPNDSMAARKRPDDPFFVRRTQALHN